MRMILTLLWFAVTTSITASAAEIMHLRNNCVVKELGAGSAALNISIGSLASIETTTGRQNGSIMSGPNSIKIGSVMVVGKAGRYYYTEKPTRDFFEILGAPQKAVVNIVSRSTYTGKSTVNLYINDQKIAGLVCLEEK